MSLLEIIKIVRFIESEGSLPDLNIFLGIAASVAGAATVNSNGIKTLLANGLSTFPLKAIQFLVMVLIVYVKILLIVIFYANEFLIILY